MEISSHRPYNIVYGKGTDTFDISPTIDQFNILENVFF